MGKVIAERTAAQTNMTRQENGRKSFRNLVIPIPPHDPDRGLLAHPACSALQYHG
jgi:hypothetical protein